MSGEFADAAVSVEGVDTARRVAVGPPRIPAPRARGHAASPAERTGGRTVDAAADRPTVEVTGSLATWLRQWGLHVEVMGAFVAGCLAAFAAHAQPFVALAALGLYMAAAYHRGQAVTTPLAGQLKLIAHSVTMPIAVLAVGVGFAGVPAAHLPQAFAAVGSAVAWSLVSRGVRWRLQSPVRVLVVGDRTAVATAAARWAGAPRVRLVGGLVVEPELTAEHAPREILGVPTELGLASVRERVAAWRADLVLVSPGPGLTAAAFRRLTWQLEQDRVAVGVDGLLSSIAPHRITPGWLEPAAIIDVRAPRPSTFVRGLKSALDRLVGSVLLVLVAPLLLAMVVAVRLDSSGPALFKQVRIGRDGRPFELYKMRTMVEDAEAIKAGLQDANEFDAVLFKLRRDPRVTRVGAFLRTSSLDELPQLINVVRGEMSLVGPRPFVPQEVARMDEAERRRHAVQPGMTGLWQVSGRSDLPWEESAALDTFYADNWSLSGDLAITLRTVKAVVAGKGAY